MKKILLFALLACGVVFAWHCKREPSGGAVSINAPVSTPISNVNPFSLSNIQKVYAKMNKGIGTARAATNLNSIDSQLLYFSFNPANLTPDQYGAFEKSTSAMVLDFPFANGAVVNDTTLTPAKIQLLKDGKIYVVAPVQDSVVIKMKASTNMSFQSLDTLVFVPDTDSIIYSMALQEAGISPMLLGICLRKRPHGQLRYYDSEKAALEPVRHAKVWAIKYGIPVSDETDDNGYYEISERFDIGAIMGVDYTNSRVKIKPLTTDGTLSGSIVTGMLLDFLIGPRNTYGWVGSCAMRDGKNIDLYGHTRERFWAQILNAYYFHDQYAAQDGITAAPPRMNCYAHWKTNTSGFGNASTPLLSQFPVGEASVAIILSYNLDIGSITASIYNLIRRALPDMTISVGSVSEPPSYSPGLAQILFHELGHASQYNQVGAIWYANMMNAEVTAQAVTGNPYGDGTYQSAGLVALTESWAEYIGTNHALRRYPNGKMNGSTISGLGFMSTLIETEGYFYGGSWIPYGMYHDLNDVPNVNESWDNVSGVTIKQMYQAFGPTILTMCAYKEQLAKNAPALGMWPLFDHYTPVCPGARYGNTALNITLNKNDCGNGVQGPPVAVTVPANSFYSTVSTAIANAQAMTYAQTYANQHATCPCLTCTDVNKKCINGICETGNQVFTSSEKLNGTPIRYRCFYHYKWSDGSISPTYYVIQGFSCAD